MAKLYRFKYVLLLVIYISLASEPIYHLLCLYYNATICDSYENH